MRISRVATALLVMVAVVTSASGQTEDGVVSESVRVWNGPTLTFEKADGADPSQAANQDRITDSVWITRANDGGQIFNARVRDAADKTDSPVETRWAVGTTDEVENLSFTTFRAAVGKPQEVVGQNLVLFIVPEQIILDVRFTSWSQGRRGGFAYERSTP